MAQSIDGIHKRCCTCGHVKLMADFNKDKNRPDGREPACKECKTRKKPEDREPVAVKPNRMAVSQAIIEYLETTIDSDKVLEEGHINGNVFLTNAQKIAFKLISQATKGESQAVKTILERVEGAVKQSYVVDTTVTTKNEQLVASANDLLQKLRNHTKEENTPCENSNPPTSTSKNTP